MTKDGHDGYVWYAKETTYGVLSDDQTWTRLLETVSISGRGGSQEVKDIRRHGKRGRAGSPKGKRDESNLVFEVSMVDDNVTENAYDVFLQSIFNESYDVTPSSYTFLISDVANPIGATTDQLEYYYGCQLDEVEMTIEEGELIMLTLSFIRQTFIDSNSELHSTTAPIVIDATANTVIFADVNPDTISRASGSWVTDGFVAGMNIAITNSTSNNFTYTIATVSALTLTLIAADAVVAETNTTSVDITFTSLNVYTAYPSAITYMLWSDVTISKEAGGSWTNIGVLSNISSFSFSIVQGGEKKFRLNQSKLPKDIHFGEYTVTASMTVDYDDFNEITELTSENSGDIQILISPTAGLVATITLVNGSFEAVEFDSEVNSLITIDIDLSVDSITLA